MITIGIKGSCITREAFNFSDKYVIEKYWFKEPLVAMMSDPINLSKEILDEIELYLLNKNSKNFMIKKYSNSIKKTYFDNYSASDYFIIDLIDERLNMTKVNDKMIFDYEKGISDILSKKYEIKYIKNNFEMWKIACDKFFEKLLNYYNEEKIILHKGWALNSIYVKGKKYILSDFYNCNEDSKKKFVNNKSMHKDNEFLTKCYDYIISKYPNIKIIELEIDKYSCDPDHRLLRSFYHYEKKYYFDFLEKLDKITSDNYSVDEVKKVEMYNKNILRNITNNIEQYEGNISEINKFKNEILNRFNQFEKNIIDRDNFINESNRKEKVYRYSNGEIRIKDVIEDNKHFKQHFDENGCLTEEYKYIDNILVEEKKYESNTIKFLYKYYDDGNLEKFIEYYENKNMKKEVIYGEFSCIGQVYSETNYDINGKKNKFVRYFSTGEKYAENIYNPPGVTYKCVYYDKKGNIIQEKYFEKYKVIKELNYNGQTNVLTKEVEYFNNGIQRSIKKFDNKGNLVKHMERKNTNDKFSEIL